MARSITDVIAQLRKVIPAEQTQLLRGLISIEESAPYTAPEAEGLLWQRLGGDVNAHCVPIDSDWKVSAVALLADISEAEVRRMLAARTSDNGSCNHGG
jgi:hypothetical protein